MLINFVPTDEEVEIVARIYEHAGCKRPGQISGDAIVDIFSEGVDLSPVVLSNIWNIADEDKSGYLSEHGLAIAVRLIGWAQKGEEVKVPLVNEPKARLAGPLPMFKGPLQTYIQYNEPNCPRPEWPPFTPHSRDVFNKLFKETGPVGGLLAGDKVRDIFLQSGLPAEDLWKIWNFADTQQRGNLDINDFALGMYLIQVMLSGPFKTLPPSIPTHVRRSIFSPPPKSSPPPTKPTLKSRSSSSASLGSKDKSPSLPPVPESSIPAPSPKLSYIPPATQSAPPTVSRAKFRSNSGNSIYRDVNEWIITPAEKEQSNREFDSLDTEKQGFLEGDELAKYMLTFKLPPEDLAMIWDLADVNNDNRLTQDGFAIAMHLIRKKTSGVPLPTTLPQSLLPIQYPQNTPTPTPPQQPRAPQALQVPLPQPSQAPAQPRPPISRRSSSMSASGSPTSPSSRRPPPLPPKPISPMVDVQRRRTMSAAPTAVLRQSGYFDPEPSDESPIPPATVPLAQYEEIVRDNARLKLGVEDLTKQLGTESDLQTRNRALSEEVESLIAKMHEMEQTSSHLLRMNEEQQRTLEELTDQNEKLTRQVSQMDELREDLATAKRRLDVSIQEKRDLGARLYEARESAEEAAGHSREEVENLKRRIERLEEEKEEIQERARRLERAISEPQGGQSGSSPMTNVQEMQILMGDVTRENEQLKIKLRDLQRSTAQMFMSSSGSQAEIDELRRANSGLKAQLEEMEMLMGQLQRSSDENELLRVMKDVTHENDGLKARMRAMREEVEEAERRRVTAQLSSNTQVEELRQEAQGLREEIRELQLRLQSRGARRRSSGHEDDALPPPAYEELPVGVDT